MIRMISGVTRIGNTTMTPESGIFAADPAIEARLVAAEVAEHANGGVATPENGEYLTVKGGTLSDCVSGSTGAKSGQSEDTAELQTGEVEVDNAVEIVNGHMTFDSLMGLTRSNMEKMAEDMGLDIRKCKNKSDIANLLSAVEVQTEIGDEVAPNLGAEDPII